MKNTTHAAPGLSLPLLIPSSTGDIRADFRGRRFRAVLCAAVAALLLSVPAKADVVTDWNETTLATQAAVPGAIRTPPAARALAMVHIAIFDSVNAVDRKYTPYAVGPFADHSASPETAAAAAAHSVLVSLYPTRQASLDAAYTASLAAIPNGSSKTAGISVGESVAALILALRSGDGSCFTARSPPSRRSPQGGIREAGFAGGSSGSQVNVLDFGVGTFVREFDFLGVDGEHVFEFATVGQSQVYALIAHARLRQLEEPFDPAWF